MVMHVKLYNAPKKSIFRNHIGNKKASYKIHKVLPSCMLRTSVVPSGHISKSIIWRPQVSKFSTTFWETCQKIIQSKEQSAIMTNWKPKMWFVESPCWSGWPLLLLLYPMSFLYSLSKGEYTAFDWITSANNINKASKNSPWSYELGRKITYCRHEQLSSDHSDLMTRPTFQIPCNYIILMLNTSITTRCRGTAPAANIQNWAIAQMITFRPFLKGPYFSIFYCHIKPTCQKFWFYHQPATFATKYNVMFLGRKWWLLAAIFKGPLN